MLEYNIFISFLLFVYIYENNFIYFHVINYLAFLFIINYDLICKFVNYMLVEPYYDNDIFSLVNLLEENEFKYLENEKSYKLLENIEENEYE